MSVFNITHLSHTAVALFFQILVFLITGNPWYGVIFAFCVYGSREVTQAEYKYIQKYCDNSRAKMPEYAGFLINQWSTDAVLDFVCPAIASLLFAFSTLLF